MVTLVQERTVAAGESHRFDWNLRALKPGKARLIVRALTEVSSDSMGDRIANHSIYLGSAQVGIAIATTRRFKRA